MLGQVADNVTISDRIDFVNAFGLALVLPVSTLVFASASFGDLVDDQTLVYLWLRDIPRWRLAASAMLSTLTIVIPLVAVPLIATAVAAGSTATPSSASVIATIIGAVAYTGVFTALGLRTKRALVWGLLYIFIWEQFIARAGHGVRRFALSAYTRLGAVQDLRHADHRRRHLVGVRGRHPDRGRCRRVRLRRQSRLDRHDVA